MNLSQHDLAEERGRALAMLDALRQQRRDIAAQREQLADLEAEGICPICARQLGKHFQPVLDLLDEQLQAVTVDGKWYRARLEQLDDLAGGAETVDDVDAAELASVGALAGTEYVPPDRYVSPIGEVPEPATRRVLDFRRRKAQ